MRQIKLLLKNQMNAWKFFLFSKVNTTQDMKLTKSKDSKDNSGAQQLQGDSNFVSIKDIYLCIKLTLT